MARTRRKREQPARGASRPSTADWQLQEAKARFSELFRLAREKGPQRVTRHGRAAVVVLPEEEYERMRLLGHDKDSLVHFFARSPLAGSGFQFDREPDYGRDVRI